MKKFSGLALAGILLSAAFPAKAELFKNLKTKGEIEIHGVMTKNVRDARNEASDDYRNTQARISFGATYDLLDDVHAAGTFEKSDLYFGKDGTGDGVLVQEANIAVDKLFDKWNARLGRQFFGEEGDMIIYYGPQHGNEDNGSQAIDAMRFDYTGDDKMIFTAVWAKTNEVNPTVPVPYSSTTIAGDADTTFQGVTAMYKLTEKWDLGGYAYNRRTGKDTANYDGGNLWVFGVKARSANFLGLKASAEAACNRGINPAGTPGVKSPSLTGWGFLVKLNYPFTVEGSGGFNFRAMAAYGSGDNKGLNPAGADNDNNFYAINPDFRPGEIFGNSGGNFAATWPGTTGNTQVTPVGTYWNTRSLTNLSVATAGMDYMPLGWPKSTLSMDIYRFKINSADGASATGLQGNLDIGSEVDLKWGYKHSENVTLSLTLAKFFPGNMARRIANSCGTGYSQVTKLASDLMVRF